jgi:hypothetical protein
MFVDVDHGGPEAGITEYASLLNKGDRADRVCPFDKLLSASTG